MRILAFKADADFWCSRCAQEVYPGCLTADVDDREGNLVCPIFEGADNLLLERCCRCGEELDPPPAEIEDEVHAILSDLAGHGTDLSASDIIDLAWRRAPLDADLGREQETLRSRRRGKRKPETEGRDCAGRENLRNGKIATMDTLLLIATRSGDFFYQSGYAAIVARVAGVKSPPLRAEPGWNKIRYQYKNLLAKLTLEVRPLSVDWDFLQEQFRSDVERAQSLNEKY